MKGWIILIPLAAIGYAAFSPAFKPIKITKMANMHEIPGEPATEVNILDEAKKRGHDVAMFGAGCFWGVEAQFRGTKGVYATAVGYSGGTKANATYHQVCNDETGHAEVVLVEFDPRVLPYRDLVNGFFGIHDPTEVNRQGPDWGSQYRSAIFTYGDEQAKTAAEAKAELDKSKEHSRPIATQIAPAGPFWMAEEYHQQYYEKKGYPPGKGVCAVKG